MRMKEQPRLTPEANDTPEITKKVQLTADKVNLPARRNIGRHVMLKLESPNSLIKVGPNCA